LKFEPDAEIGQKGAFFKGLIMGFKVFYIGRLFIAPEKIAPARDFRLFFHADAGSALVMGEKGPFEPDELLVKVPRNETISPLTHKDKFARFRLQKGFLIISDSGR